MIRFAFRHMFVRRARVALVMLSVILSACVALLAYNISRQVSEGIISTAAYYDIIIGPAGSSTQLAMNTMFFTDEPLGTISYEYVEEIETSGLANDVVPFTMGDSYNGAAIVGTTPRYLEGRELASGEMFEETYEAVVGSAVARQYGIEPGDMLVTSHGLSAGGSEHASSPLRVTGILRKTGTAYDNVIFTGYETVWATHGGSHASEAETEAETEAEGRRIDSAARSHGQAVDDSHDEAEDAGKEGTKEAEHEHTGSGEICAILVRSKSFNDYYRLTEYYGSNAELICINPASVLREVLEQVDLSKQIVYILCAVILVMNLVVVSVITLLNMYDAQKEIALMRLIGVSMRRIGDLYLFENSLTGLVAVLLALGASRICLMLMGEFVSGMGIVLNAARVYPAEWVVMAVVFVISILPTMARIRSMSRRDGLR